MKTFLTAIVVALALPSAALAEDFSGEITWGEVAMTGGIGPEGNWAMAGNVDGTYEVTRSDGTSGSGTMHCVGMDIDDGPYQLRLSCDARATSSHTAMALQCLWRGERGPGTPLSCVGWMTGREGAFQGRGGMITMDWYATGRSHVVGQWWAAAE